MTIPTSKNFGFAGPLPGPGFHRAAARASEPSLEYQQSGTITAHKNFVLGSPRRNGRVTDAYLSLGNGGKEAAANVLSLELDVKIDGTSVFTTKPKIAYVSGEAATMKTTVVSGDTGITLGVLDSANCSYSAGDVVMGKLTVTRTASPATEMQDAAVVVILSPTDN